MGKRLPNESFEDYRARLKEESKALKQRLRGEFVWISSVIVPDEKDKFKSTKVRMQGTYKKKEGENK